MRFRSHGGRGRLKFSESRRQRSMGYFFKSHQDAKLLDFAERAVYRLGSFHMPSFDLSQRRDMILNESPLSLV